MMRHGESGNVIYYLFIAIALLAALTFAVSQGSRSSVKNLSEDRERLLATEILDYGQTVKSATTQLRLRGVQFEQLSFAHPDLDVAYGTYDANPAYEVFNPAGGGVIYKDVSSDAQDTPLPYIFNAGNVINLVGTSCMTSACAELALYLPVKRAICLTINDMLNIANPGGVPPNGDDLDYSPFAGSATGAELIAWTAGHPLEGKLSGCFYDGPNETDYFYQILLPR
jgi:hypothetical protein